MIETERLILRQHTQADFDAYHAIMVDPAVIEFIAAGKPATAEEAWNKLARNAGFWPLLGYGLLAVIERQTQAYVGLTGLAQFHRGLGDDFDPYPEAAWTCASSFQGRGYAAEAAVAAHEWFGAKHGWERTVCIIDALNLPSLKMAEKIGYRAYDEAIYKDKRVIKFERRATK